MSKKRYVVELRADERKRLEELIRKGKSPAKKQLKARILLRADESPLGPKWNDPQISEALSTYPMMCARVRQQWAQGGMDAVLNRKQRATPPIPRIFDGEKEARLIALACSQPPEGRALGRDRAPRRRARPPDARRLEPGARLLHAAAEDVVTPGRRSNPRGSVLGTRARAR